MSAPELRRAVFLDRDGVLNRVVMRDGKAASPRAVDELQIEPEAPATLRSLKAAGYLLFVVTNQPDVRRGLMSAEALDALHARLAELLPVDEIAACLHDNADGCACRKPKPGLVLDLAERHRVDLRQSWLIGDQDRDIACGKAAGCKTVLLERDYNSGMGANPDQVVETLSQSLAHILHGP
ncbi:HAD-IIIA family hydrolase [Caulobacter sp. X]|uniref:D-glycero-alpha-D-manno-heptose-1,7-bisphosphate 7-phosphatase n=1 Tax=Caulobacter sp. X TaxID=2048901 RepID=UPI000C15648F|nr:HAD family hydrolase [Caulobacter sp. X]PIC00135.1 D,D-heptose 1,7-bisphosphate phosphatase [Caulobacter sp. X]